MTVQCPHCATSYLLPEHLLGPRGARVRCPQCGRSFVVPRQRDAEFGRGEQQASPDPDVAPTAGDEPEATDEPRATDEPHAIGEPRLAETDPEACAREVLDALAADLGPRLEQAVREGRALSAFGPELLRGWDAYRDQMGERADSAAFRRVLRERWGVDLGPGAFPEAGPSAARHG